MDNKLSEGSIYTFNVVRKLEMPDQEQYWLLKSPFEKKLLLYEKYYSNYNIQVGKDIQCKVDKINCNGRIFLEPLHPVYSVGKDYEFTVKSADNHINAFGDKVIAIELYDVFNNIINIQLNNKTKLPEVKSKIKCKVIKLKKGKPQLLPSDEFEDGKNFKLGRYYSFSISGDKEVEGEQYYILRDFLNREHLLLKSRYNAYKFRIGESINCCVKKKTGPDSYEFEPEHPHYRLGKVYNFEFVKSTVILNQVSDNERVYIVKDIYDNNCYVRSFGKNALYEQPPMFVNNSKQIQCRVEAIKNGKPALSYVY